MVVRKIINKKWLIRVAILLVAFILAILTIDQYVAQSASDRIYSDINKIPKKRAAVVLGTTKYAAGRQNLYYRYRLDAVEQLFKMNKVDAILISGDNATRYYNEPIQMQKDLIKRGIPAEYITLDYAGFRTLDSIIRAKEVFNLDNYVVVSQRFHCERALYIAKAKGYNNTIAFQADGPRGVFSWRVRIREVFARLNAFFDINLLNTAPKFLGEKEVVRYRSKHPYP